MIGLIFGENDFPKVILKKIKLLKLKYFIIDLSKKKIFKKEKNSYQLNLGQFGKMLNLLQQKKCKKILFAGKIDRPNFSSLKVDVKALFYMPRVISKAKLGDAALLKEIVKIFSEQKVKVISSINYNPELSLKKGIYSKLKPNNDDKNNINKAIKEFNKINKYNHTQGIIVNNQKINAIEGKGGTEKMIKNYKSKKIIGNPIMLKFPKKKQDLRIDLPTIGLNTIKLCQKAKIKGIVLKSNNNVFMEKSKSIKFINKNNMFLAVK